MGGYYRLSKKIVFLTGTRADYGKIKTLMKVVQDSLEYELNIFVTGIHMLNKYGSTYREIEKDGFVNIYKYINQKNNMSDQMDIILSNTITGFSNYVSEIKPDMIIVHGDRVEALAGSIVGALNNIKVMHIEGGEISGTIDESIRHAITKFAHYHLVANEEAKRRIIQLGEKEENIFIFGSADLDIMYSDSLPSIEDVKEKYGICFEQYAILMYHSVTTEINYIHKHIEEVIKAVEQSNKNYIIIYPNNDNGSDIILEKYKNIKNKSKINIYPSMRFEYFLTLLKYSEFIIGNSSCGIREAGVYGVPVIDLGSRQQGRYNLNENSNIKHVQENFVDIMKAINEIPDIKRIEKSYFGQGNSSDIFREILKSESVWESEIQKKFNDIDF